MTQERKQEKEQFRKRLMQLVLPIAFQQFMLALVSACDALMLGKVEQDALSAVSLAGQVTFVQNLFLAAMTIGTSMFAAQYWGKKDKESVEKIFAYVLKITIVVSAFFFLAGIGIPKQLMRIFTNDPILIEKGAQYLRVVALSYLLSGISQIYLCILKNSDEAVKSTVISSTAVVLNVILNGILIFGLFHLPRMEIVGASLATVISKAIELAWCVGETLRPGKIRFRMAYVKKNDSVLSKDFWKYTTPVLANEIIWGCGFTMYSVIMGHLGSDAVAANSIANVVKNLLSCFCIGLGSGGGIMVGNELGAGNLEKAKKYGSRLCRWAIGIGAVSGIVLVSISPLVIRMVGLTEQAQHYLFWMLVMCSCYMVGKAINCTTIAGIFCAGGDSKFGLKCDTIVMWCITVPLGLILAFVVKAPVLVVFFLVNMDEMFKLPAVYRNYKKYQWVKNLTKND